MKEMVCIVCPNGCHLEVNEYEGNIHVSGNLCPRGETFAKAELTCPMRTIASTVKTVSTHSPVTPVRVSSEIPKDKIFDVMNEIQKVVLDHDVAIGDVIIANVLGLNVDVIATAPFHL